METSKNELNREINELKSQLNALNSQKESWFSRKESIQKEISILIYEIKKVRSERSKVFSSHDKNKDERNKQNRIVKYLISEIKELNNKKAEFIKKSKLKGDPERIHDLIEALEQKIETEALTFDKEKAVMKRINALKKQYFGYSELKLLIGAHRLLSAKIMEHKKLANEFHSLMRQSGLENKEDNEKIIEISRKIMLLRKEKEEATKKFLEFKAKFKEANNLLKSKLLYINSIKQSENMERRSIIKNKEQKIRTILEEKIKNVEEKIKRKQKLTTEDIITFQKGAS